MAREGTHNPPPSARSTTKAHPVVAPSSSNPHDPPHAISVGCRPLWFWRSFAPRAAFFWSRPFWGRPASFVVLLAVWVYLCSEAANRLGVSAFGRLLEPVCRSSVHWRSRSHCSRLDSHCSRLLLHYERYAMRRKPARSKADRR